MRSSAGHLNGNSMKQNNKRTPKRKQEKPKTDLTPSTIRYVSVPGRLNVTGILPKGSVGPTRSCLFRQSGHGHGDLQSGTVRRKKMPAFPYREDCYPVPSENYGMFYTEDKWHPPLDINAHPPDTYLPCIYLKAYHMGRSPPPKFLCPGVSNAT